MRKSLMALLAMSLTTVMATGTAAQSEEPAWPSSGCEAPLAEPGDYADIYAVGDTTAKYWAVVPEAYAEDVPVPLVLWLSSGDGDADRHHAGWRPYLDGIGELFVVVARPAGLGSWATDPLLLLIDRLEGDYCIDSRRIHVMGESSSSSAASRLVCQASERIASFLDGMGRFAPNCTLERPVPLVAFTGKADHDAVTSSVERWAEWNGCEAEPVVEDLGSGVSRHTYQGCVADIVLFDIESAGHSFIFHECIGPVADYCRAYAEVDQLEEALAFFERHPLPAE